MQGLIKILTREENVRMQYEILLMLCVFSVSALMLRDNKRKLAAAWGLVIGFFLYIHRILLPVLVSGLYLYMLAGLLCMLVLWRGSGFMVPYRALRRKAALYLQHAFLPYTLVPVLIVMIQACRINIAIDYDSLRYGLRSDVLLTGGQGLKGFFLNTGLVNLVYTYPKGFEVLTRPLYLGHTYGFVLAVNLWVLVLVLLSAGSLAGKTTGIPGAEILTACMLSLIPGVTNMAVTAKSDLMTLLCQLGFLTCVVQFLYDGGEPSDTQTGLLVGCGLASLLMSYGLKPTALVFSSVLGLAALGTLLFFCRKNGSRICLNGAGLRALFPTTVFVVVITARTFLITGMPFTSVFTGLFERMGMQLHYPFRIQQVSTGTGRSLTEGIRFFLVRLGKLLLSPTGEDMAHVRMAWSGLAFFLMLLTFAFAGRALEALHELLHLHRIQKTAPDQISAHASVAHTDAAPHEAMGGRLSASSGSEESQESPAALRLLLNCTAVVGAVSLISLYLLYQIDGNYYMLLYALVTICGASIVSILSSYAASPLGRNLPNVFGGEFGRAWILLAAVMIWFTAFTGWAGPVGFTPVDFLNRGYYNHEAEYGLSDPLHLDRHTRILAFAGEPECYLLKGRVESWVDLDGSGGNVYLTDTKFNIFKEYCDFADIDYICADLAFLHDTADGRHERAYTLFTWLLEDGDFEEIVLAENSSVLVFARIDKPRIAEPWETALSEEKQMRTNEQCEWFASIGGYR